MENSVECDRFNSIRNEFLETRNEKKMYGRLIGDRASGLLGDHAVEVRNGNLVVQK